MIIMQDTGYLSPSNSQTAMIVLKLILSEVVFLLLLHLNVYNIVMFTCLTNRTRVTLKSLLIMGF
jgi:hypothetical protein